MRILINTTIHIIELIKGLLLVLKIIHVLTLVEVNDKDPNFKTGDHIRTSKHKKNVFLKEYALNWSEEVFAFKKKNKNTVP